MDYRSVYMGQQQQQQLHHHRHRRCNDQLLTAISVCLCAVFLLLMPPPARGIISRDLILTPKQGLQLNGRNVYYEEESNEILRNQSVRPWERTLKHVTFVTLFTRTAAKAAAGNVSTLQAYNDFLHSPYITDPTSSATSGGGHTRFGDIVTLARGRLEDDGGRPGNGSSPRSTSSFRFVEGTCDYDCDTERVWALWQVQKIRHRDSNRKFRYEMKFSVSPLRGENAGGGTTKRKADNDESGYRPRNAPQTFIQKEDDYPQNFNRIIYPDEENFADRRLDEYQARRNFRQPPVDSGYHQVTPMPQATFTHSVFQPRPPLRPPPPERLNYGEYVKGYPTAPKATPKIELYPNLGHLFGSGGGGAGHYPTTYRPHQHVRFPRPEIYQPQHEIMKFPDDDDDDAPGRGGGKLETPIVAHHYHHHFYMPSGSSLENGIGSEEDTVRPVRNKDPSDDAGFPQAYATYNHRFTERHLQPSRPEAPEKINFPIASIERQRLVHVTPVAPLKKPQLYQMYPISIGQKVPLLIYPAPVDEEVAEGDEQSTTPHGGQGFRQSAQIVEPIRYSDPDPLYTNTGIDQNGLLPYNGYTSQLEKPKAEDYVEESVVGVGVGEKTSEKSKPDSVTAQLPPPDKDQDTNVPYVEESMQSTRKTKNHLESDSGQQSSTAIASVDDGDNSTRSTTESTTLPSTTTESDILQATVSSPVEPSTLALPSARVTNNFISTSTTQTPLRSISRYRNAYSRTTSTTEQPVLKWKPRRKGLYSRKYPHNDNETLEHGATSGSERHEETALPATSTEASLNMTAAQTPAEIFEVLTQKSVSKSVSIKVGKNGEEMPIIVEDQENEVKGN